MRSRNARWLGGLALAAVAAGALYQARGGRADARQCPPPGRLVDVGGFRLHLDCRGEGEPAVLFESGISASSLSWRLVQAGVSDLARACCYDRSGLAWSDPSPAPRTLEGMVDDLATLLDRTGLSGPLVLVGHSFGSFIVRAFAARYPERTAGVILVDPVEEQLWARPAPERIRLLRGGVFLSYVGVLLATVGVVRGCLELLGAGRTAVPRAVGRSFGLRAYEVMTRVVGHVTRLPEEAVTAIRAHWCHPKSFRAMARHLAALPGAARAAAALGPLGDIPLVVLTAVGNPEANIEAQARLARLSGRGRQVLVESGHWVQIDRPDAVIDAIREVVAVARPRSTRGEGSSRESGSAATE